MKLSRRTILRGLSGLSASLPWLEVIAENNKKAKPATNTAFFFMPNGVNPHEWTPTGEGRDYKTSSILKPLDAVRSEFDIFTNLDHEKSKHGDGHYAKTANFLSGNIVKKTSGKNLHCGVSADQLIAQSIGHKTALPSIELGIEPTRTGVDTNVGFTQVYGGHISWNNATTPVPKEIYPQLAFDRLFSNNSKSAGITSILDEIKDDVKILNKQLGAEDRIRMSEFYSSLRSLEKRIQRSAMTQEKDKVVTPSRLRPEDGLPQSLQEHMTLMLDIITLAFKMKRTHVASFMFGNAVSGKNFSFLNGVEGGFHQLSHHANNKEKMAMYAKINTFHMTLFAHFLQKMKACKEGDQTLLDNSLIMIGSGLRDGNQHSPVNLPILVAGKGGTKIKRGQHRVFPANTPLSNILLGFMKNSGLDIDQFGSSTEAII
jgi:hypothetical protein